MSTAVAASPGQLYFAWMQAESCSSGTRAKAARANTDFGYATCATPARSAGPFPDIQRCAIASTSRLTHGEKDSPLGRPVERSRAVANDPLPPREGQRLGQVRIGKVMMSLLKKYGITEQEISEVLATIALENSQGLAG